MKRHLIILLIVVGLVPAAAQRKGGFDPEKFRVALEQFITTEVGLTQQEQNRFFPLYNELQTKQRALFDRQRALGRQKPADDKKCAVYIQQSDELNVQMKKLQQTYHNKFLKVLPASKVFDILKAEEKFHRQMFRKAAGKHPNDDRGGAKRHEPKR